MADGDGIKRVLTPAEVLLGFAEKREPELIGCYESQTVEFKGRYHLEGQHGKWELAKDVAAMANGGGGVIVVGVLTEPDNDRAEDVATELKPLPPELFNPRQFREILETWVYPPPHVAVERHVRKDKVYGTIMVTPRDADDPYVLNRIPVEDGKVQANTAVGWPERVGAHTSWKAVGQVHAAIQRGLRTSVYLPGASTEPQGPVALTELQSALDAVEAFMGWDDRAFVWLAAIPEIPQSVPGFYGDRGVEGAIRRPHELRYAGFGLTYGRYDNDDGRLISADGDERYFEVRPNGVAIAAAASGSAFLTRVGRIFGSETSPAPQAINPVVLTEWTYLFCNFVADQLATRTEGAWRLAVGVRGARERVWGLRMRAGQWSSREMTVPREGSQAGKDTWETDIRSVLVPGIDAYTLLRRLYDLFGLDVDDLTLVSEGAVSSKAIANLS